MQLSTKSFGVGESSVKFIFNARLTPIQTGQPISCSMGVLKPSQDYFKERIGQNNPTVIS